mmetsp:Transcript_26809/g.57568  ORF Transcript_26809/g.57568 Transcript_26809/m.57568 type:complete len:81 (-) Transcript_26809:866-1108(-)
MRQRKSSSLTNQPPVARAGHAPTYACPKILLILLILVQAVAVDTADDTTALVLCTSKKSALTKRKLAPGSPTNKDVPVTS